MLYKLAGYKNLTNGVIALQRAELQKVRLEIDRERLELLREKRRNKSASSSSAPASSTESASPEDVGSSSPAHTEAPEPHSSETPPSPPLDEVDSPQELRAPSLSTVEGSPANAESLPGRFAGPTAPLPNPELSAPATVTPVAASAPAPSIRTVAPVLVTGAQTQASQPPPATPPNPVAAQNAPLWPVRRPGGSPCNVSPRNPLGLL